MGAESTVGFQPWLVMGTPKLLVHVTTGKATATSPDNPEVVGGGGALDDVGILGSRGRAHDVRERLAAPGECGADDHHHAQPDEGGPRRPGGGGRGASDASLVQTLSHRRRRTVSLAALGRLSKVPGRRPRVGGRHRSAAAGVSLDGGGAPRRLGIRRMTTTGRPAQRTRDRPTPPSRHTANHPVHTDRCLGAGSSFGQSPLGSRFWRRTSP